MTTNNNKKPDSYIKKGGLVQTPEAKLRYEKPDIKEMPINMTVWGGCNSGTP